MIAEARRDIGRMTILRHIKNKLRQLFATNSVPIVSDFAAMPTPELWSAYRGAAGDLVFENQGPLIHKWLHYLPIYDDLLLPYVGRKVRMLEIGVSAGGSLKLWRQLLGGQATIFGIDINPDCYAHDGNYAAVRIGSQADPQFLRNIVHEMGGIDVVLDDGSHIASHQRASFNVLFPLLSDGGLYIIEDLHTAYWPAYEGGLKRRGTAIEFLKGKIDEMHRHYRAKGLNTVASLPTIDSIQFFDSIAVVRKCKKRLPRHHVKVPA